MFCSSWILVMFFAPQILVSDAVAKYPDGALQLPKITDMFISLVSVEEWRYDLQNKTVPCTAGDANAFSKCGAEELIAAWLPTAKTQHLDHLLSGTDAIKNSNGSMVGTSGEFMEVLELYCDQMYIHYKKCVNQWKSPPSCSRTTRYGIRYFYQYACEGPGRTALNKVGDCLVNMKSARISAALRQIPGCNPDTFDISGDLMDYMLTTVRESYTGQQIKSLESPLRYHIRGVCAEWQSVEKCYIPALAHICGPEVKTFYSGLLHHQKQLLMQDFPSKDLMQCSQALEKAKSGENGDNGERDTNFVKYLQKERQDSRHYLNRLEVAYCPCSALAVMTQSQFCFWDACTKFRDFFIKQNRSDIDKAQQICQAVPLFRKCYNIKRHCKLAGDFNVDIIAANLCDAVEVAMNNPLCAWSLVSTITKFRPCGLTLSKAVKYLLFMASIVYQKIDCVFAGETRSFPVINCLQDAVEQTTAKEHPLCDNKDKDIIITGVEGLVGIVKMSQHFYQHVYEEQCNNNFTGSC